MSNLYSRRRFLNDLLFVGGIVAVSAGIAAIGARPPETVTATPSASPTPVETCEPPMPGQMVAPPPPVVSPTPHDRPLPGRRRLPDPPSRYQTGGKPQQAPPPR